MIVVLELVPKRDIEVPTSRVRQRTFHKLITLLQTKMLHGTRKVCKLPDPSVFLVRPRTRQLQDPDLALFRPFPINQFIR